MSAPIAARFFVLMGVLGRVRRDERLGGGVGLGNTVQEPLQRLYGGGNRSARIALQVAKDRGRLAQVIPHIGEIVAEIARGEWFVVLHFATVAAAYAIRLAFLLRHFTSQSCATCVRVFSYRRSCAFELRAPRVRSRPGAHR